MRLFDKVLAVSQEELEIELRGLESVPWSDFLLNPRRLRGSDFLMRWSQGIWSEQRVMEAVNNTDDFCAFPYGPSGTAPDGDVRESELYFERLEQAGLGDIKRPDILIFKKCDESLVRRMIEGLGGVEELPFTAETDMQNLLDAAILAIECENSLWRVTKMRNFGAELRPMRRLGGKLGLPKNAVLPTIILKDEDRKPLLDWQQQQEVPIHIWHVFYDRSYGISLDRAEELFADGLIERTDQVYQAPGGATTTKSIYKIYYHYAYELGEAIEEPTLVPDCIDDSNGHILPYVRFEGGRIRLAEAAIQVLNKTADSEG